jgi:hypothetical protein
LFLKIGEAMQQQQAQGAPQGKAEQPSGKQKPDIEEAEVEILDEENKK